MTQATILKNILKVQSGLFVLWVIATSIGMGMAYGLWLIAYLSHSVLLVVAVLGVSGCVMGFAQWRVLRSRVAGVGHKWSGGMWALGSAVGGSLTALASLAYLTGFSLASILLVASGGATMGLIQSAGLRHHLSGIRWWAPWTLTNGCVLPAWVLLLALSPTRPRGIPAEVFFGAITLVHSAITGAVLVWLLWEAPRVPNAHFSSASLRWRS